MATFYLDFENGNDANTGADWANAWKTINSGATAARTAPGDTIRFAKTADPTSIGNATWTNLSATVTLATAQTTTIYLDGGWTAANGSTSGTSTVRKEGTTSNTVITPAATAINTKYSYLTIGGGAGVDFSSYDAITFWFQNLTTAIADANRYVIKLCSDTTGDTAVDEFAIPAIASTSQWVPLTLKRNGGGALGNSIQSIAFYTGSTSPGNTQQIRIDDVLACDFDGLNLTSLISKNSVAYGGTETWHGLQSINGTTVILGNRNTETAGSTNLRGYFTNGTTPETVTTYIRPTFKFVMQATASSASSQPIQEGGTSVAMITYSGGWNTTSNTQDGETWIDGQNGYGFGFDIGNSKSYLKFERFGVCRFDSGLRWGAGANTGHIIENCQFTNNSTGFQTGISEGFITAVTNNNSTGATQGNSSASTIYSLISYNNAGSTTFGPSSKINSLKHNNNSAQLGLTGGVIDYLEHKNNTNGLSVQNTTQLLIQELIMTNNSSTALTGSGANLVINKLTASGNASPGAFDGFLTVKQTNATSAQLIGITATSSFKNWDTPVLMFNAVNNDVNDNRFYWWYGNGLSQTTTRHTASGIAWQLNITNARQTTNFPFNFPIAKVACNANSLVTVKAWVKLSNATDIGAKLLIQDNEIAGVTSDITATKSADTNWEELTITFTPTAKGVAQIYVQGYWLANTADESIYVDDITVTQA
jgi:hypothetical protein